MYNNYTTLIEQSLSQFKGISASHENIYDMDIKEFITDASSFRPFSEGLTELLKRADFPGDLNNSNEKADYIIEKLKLINSNIENETVFSWITGKHRPKIEPGSRKRMYELCFALNLSAELVTWFFEHVYHDRCFNCHNIDEAVYYYCFLKKLTYQNAKDIIEKIAAAPACQITEKTPLYTKFIRNRIETLDSTDSLIKYLIANKSSFDTWNVSALSQIHYYFEQLTGPKNTEDIINSLKRSWSSILKKSDPRPKPFADTREKINRCGLIIQNLYAESLLADTSEPSETGTAEYMLDALNGRNPFKISFVLDILLGTHDGLPKKMDIPYIIKNNFPSKKTFSDILDDEKSATSKAYDAIRKALILLEFHDYWYRVKLHISDTDEYSHEEHFQIFCDQINNSLEDCGYQPLFAGNPYDWIFLCSAQSDDPVKFFNSIIYDIIDE